MLTTNRSLTSSFARLTPNMQGVFFLLGGMLVLSLQNIAIKSIASGYAVLEIVVLRSLIALPCILLLYRLEGQRGVPRTQLWGLEFSRGFLLFVAYTTYFMGVAALPLAEVASIRSLSLSSP
jgi:S-adenosylmethionine uptake transporter